MSFQYDINQRLSREHRKVIREMRQLEDFLGSAEPDAEPDWSDTDVQQMMHDLQFSFESEIPNHFAIEEEELFPLLVENGLGDLVSLFLAEHRIILGLIEKMTPIVSQAATEGMVGNEDWTTLFENGDLLVSALSMHAEKEESGLVPAIDQMINQTEADRIFRRYQDM